jgi:opacity protein-like surface antigen
MKKFISTVFASSLISFGLFATEIDSQLHGSLQALHFNNNFRLGDEFNNKVNLTQINNPQNIGLQAGFGVDMSVDNFFIGPEVFANYSNSFARAKLEKISADGVNNLYDAFMDDQNANSVDFNTTNHVNTVVRSKYSLGLGLRLGTKFLLNNTGYLRLGYSWQPIEYTSYNSYLGLNQNRTVKNWAPYFGLGLESAITDNLKVFLEYTGMKTRSRKLHLSESGSDKTVNLNRQTIGIGLRTLF